MLSTNINYKPSSRCKIIRKIKKTVVTCLKQVVMKLAADAQNNGKII